MNSVILNDSVLVIDDDIVMRELLSLLLDADGRTVLTAHSGEAALDLLATLDPASLPAVILTDLKMPGISEVKLARRLRLACPPPNLLIAMSGSEPTGNEAQPFDAFLSKPFTVAELDATMERARAHVPQAQIAKGRRQRSPKSGASSLRLQSGLLPLDETIYAKLLSVMGPTQLPQLYLLFMNDAPQRIARMKSAKDANDAATFAREAHAIKGGCGMLGATEIHSLAERMETGGLACSPLLNDFQPAFERLRRILEERMHGFDGYVEERIDLESSTVHAGKVHKR